MKKVWAVADSLVSPLGLTSAENFRHVSQGYSAIKPLKSRNNEKFLAGVVEGLEPESDSTLFEQLCNLALEDILTNSKVDPAKTLLILSTTKGNIDLLEKENADHPRLQLSATSERLRKRHGLASQIVVSNACISGVLGIIVAKRLLESEKFAYAIVLGADVLTDFVVSGFQSLLALSNEPCRPFDENRRGINLGEGAAAILLTTRPSEFPDVLPVALIGAASSNDANHISGPSRTGEELANAVSAAMNSAGITGEQVDFISAHGTATLYNDEMEARAFNICGLSDVPLHSLKGYFGHTLGAAGVIETVIGIHSLKKDLLIPCLGYSTQGVTMPLNVISQLESRPLKTFLKTSSGFGGCNAAIVLQKQ